MNCECSKYRCEALNQGRLRTDIETSERYLVQSPIGSCPFPRRRRVEDRPKAKPLTPGEEKIRNTWFVGRNNIRMSLDEISVSSIKDLLIDRALYNYDVFTARGVKKNEKRA